MVILASSKPEEPSVTGHLPSQPGKGLTQHSLCRMLSELQIGGSLLTSLSILVSKAPSI